MSKEKRIQIGAIIGAHGIKGAVRIRSYTEEPEDIFTYAPITDESGNHVFALHCIGIMKDHFLARIEGIEDRNAAEALRGTKLMVARDALPETEERTYYEADLRGLEARAEDGSPLGIVECLHDYGAGAFLEIKPEGKPSFMLPFKDAFVPKVDLKGGFLTAVLPEGWLEDEEQPETASIKKAP